MEKEPHSSREELREFYGEIATLKEADEREEFKELNPYKLIEEDREIWEKYKDDTLTPEEFLRYRNEVVAGENISRQKFVVFLGNKLTPRWLEKNLPSGF